MVLKFFTIYDLWFYSSVRRMADSYTIMHVVRNFLLILIRFVFISLTGLSFDSVSVSTGDPDPFS